MEIQETHVWSLSREEPLEKGMATCILAWRIPWHGEPGGLQPMGLQRVGNSWSVLACTQVILHLADAQKVHLFFSYFLTRIFSTPVFICSISSITQWFQICLKQSELVKQSMWEFAFTSWLPAQQLLCVRHCINLGDNPRWQGLMGVTDHWVSNAKAEPYTPRPNVEGGLESMRQALGSEENWSILEEQMYKLILKDAWEFGRR